MRWPQESWLPLQQAFYEACIERGFPHSDDFNNPDSSGIGPMAQNRQGRTRISTAIGYLAPARHRLNLTIRPHCLVDRVLLEDGRAVGLAVESGGEKQNVYGENVILSAGAIQSPPILLRSGIGRAEDLGATGVDQIHELAGVGHHLIEHPMSFLMFVPKPGVCDLENPLMQTLLRYTSEDGEPNDMQIYMLNHMDLTTLPALQEAFGVDMVFAIAPGLQRPNSRGRLRVTTTDLDVQPEIELNFLDDEEDKRRMREGVRLAWDIAQTPLIQEQAERIELLDQEIVDDDDLLDQYNWDTASHIYHLVSTAKMGPSSDPQAVVDQHCRVHGIDNLRVVDASIMPNIVSANTNLTCIMIGERVAEWIAAGE